MNSTDLVVFGADGSAGGESDWDRLAEEIDDWLISLPSPATRRGYARDLGFRPAVQRPGWGPPRRPLLGGNAWLMYLSNRGIHPLEARENDVVRWLRVLEDLGYAPATRARALVSVRAFYAMLEKGERLDRSPAAGVSAAAQGIHTPTVTSTIYLSPQHSAAMIRACDLLTGPMRLRHKAVVTLLLTTGVRVGELCALNVPDYVRTPERQKLRVRGKGGRFRRLDVADLAAEALDAYLSTRTDLKVVVRRNTAGARQRIPLLMTRTGAPIVAFEVFRVLRTVAVLAGLPDEVIAQLTPHVTRHTAATLALIAGATVEEIRLLLGHASLATTQRYLHGAGEHVPRAVGSLLDANLRGTA